MRTCWTNRTTESFARNTIEGSQAVESAGRRSVSEQASFGPSPKIERRSSFMGALSKCVTIAAVAVLLGAGAMQANAQVVTNPPAAGAQIGASGSFAVGAHLDSATLAAMPKLRSPSAADLKWTLDNIRSTVTGGHTPYMQPSFEPGAGAYVSRPHNAWDAPNPVNTQYTIKTIPKDGFVHISVPVFVSGHCPDMYDADLYPRFTGKPMPDDLVERKKANAKLYSTAGSPLHNVHWLWLRHVGGNTPDEVLVKGLPSNGEPVHMVQLAIKVKPGDHLQVRWSPFVGANPDHPIAHPDGFIGGRTFDIIVPQNVTIER